MIPWSLFLAKKRVLVIHPFTESIELQYKLRENLFSNTKVLPEFNLLTLKCPQTHVYNQTGFESWFEVLQNLKNKIEKIEFDVAIIGAGAYGLPLASFVKELGKHAIHIGGATQILFGIKGKRWEDRKEFHSFFNEYWKSPLETEKPKNYKSLEEGAYW